MYRNDRTKNEEGQINLPGKIINPEFVYECSILNMATIG